MWVMVKLWKEEGLTRLNEQSDYNSVKDFDHPNNINCLKQMDLIPLKSAKIDPHIFSL